MSSSVGTDVCGALGELAHDALCNDRHFQMGSQFKKMQAGCGEMQTDTLTCHHLSLLGSAEQPTPWPCKRSDCAFCN